MDQIDARFVVRGLRAVSDFESEVQMALMNRRLNESDANRLDRDYLFPPLDGLTDVDIDGKSVRAVVQPNRNGFVYVLDAASGEVEQSFASVPLGEARAIEATTRKVKMTEEI